VGLKWNGSCSFSFDVPDYTTAYTWYDDEPTWALQTGTGPDRTTGVEDETWHCPHDAVDGFETCSFHMPPEQRDEAGVDASRRLATAVGEANAYDDPAKQTRYCQFIGATFPELNLEQTVLGGGGRSTIDLRHATFGTVACEKAEFGQPVRFDGAVFDPGDDPAYAPGREVLDPKLSTVAFPVDFTHAKFRDVASFRGAAFHQPSLFRDATFGNNAVFKRVRFYDHVSFLTADFEDLAMFNDARFDRDARFQACHCIDLVDFKRCFIGGRFNLDRIVCDGDVELDDSDLTAPPSTAAPSTVPDSFAGRITADKSVVTGRLSFNRLTVDTELRIRDATVHELRLHSPSTNEEGAYVDLCRSTIRRGNLSQLDVETSGSSGMLYDCYRTTLGDVKFHGETGRAVPRRIRFLRTKYEGYDFADSDSIDLGKIDHEIHDFTDEDASVPCYCDDGSEHDGRYIIDSVVCPRHDRKATHAALRTTYAYAKSGASAVGDNASAGAFFYRERVASRRAQFETATSRRLDVGVLTRLNVLSKWARSLLLSATTGYGEQPYRVVGASLLTILGFGLLYRSSSIPTSDPTGIDTLTFSFQSFVSFVLGPPETTSVFIRGLSAVEGFVGAFFIGLFVFTLTRRVHR
jgi:hypothetical protein